MIKNIADIEQFTLNIPKLWEKDWIGAIDMATGAQKELLVYQDRAANLLKNITDRQATFEKLAWLTIWTKTFAIADSLHGTLERNSQYILEVVSRVSFEQMLHIHTIIQPIQLYHENASEISTPLAEKIAWQEVMERLRAYTAWCFWNDKLFLEKLLDFKTLEGIWDPHPAEKIARDSDRRAKYEEIFGELEIETDDRKLKMGRLMQQDCGRHNLHRIDTWLAHLHLTPWMEKIKCLSRGRSGKQKVVSFFSLFNESEDSMSKRLSCRGMGFMYISYKQGSLFIHGSTMEQILMFQDGFFTPKFTGKSEEVEPLVSYVASMCNNIMFILHALQSHLWPSDKVNKFTRG